MQNFFGNAFVLAKRQTSRTAAGERQVLHFEKRNNVLIETRLVFELLDEVEKNVGREGLQFLPDQIDIIINGEVFRRVTELTERGHNVRLRFPVLRLQLLCEVLIELGRTCAVKEHEDFEFLFHLFCIGFQPIGSFSSYLVRLNLPVKR